MCITLNFVRQSHMRRKLRKTANEPIKKNDIKTIEFKLSERKDVEKRIKK